MVVGMVLGVLVAGVAVPLVFDEQEGSGATDVAATQFDSVQQRDAPSEPLGAGDAASAAAAAAERPEGRGTAAGAGSGVAASVAGTGGSRNATAGPTTTAPASPGPSLAPMTRTASDRGITPGTIKLGIALLDLSTANRLGLAPDHYEVETQRKSYQAQVDAINARGGIHGRKVEAVYAVADPFSADTALAACNKLAGDQKAFVVIAFAGYTADGMLCIGRQYKTPVVVWGNPPDEHFRLTEGRIATEGMAANRVMFNWVNELDRLGLLKGKKIGIVGSENSTNGDKQAVEQGLLPALKRFGYTVTYRVRLSADLPTAASQIPVEVSQMRAAGVDNVMFVTNFLNSTQWVQASEGQGWEPQYHVSDLQGLTCDVCVEDMPRSFQGAIGFTTFHFVRGAREGMPEPGIDRVCRETYNRATGENWKYGDRHPFYNACVQTEIFVRSMIAAGPNPTRASWVANTRKIGNFPLANMFGGGYNGKTDYADVLVTLKWDSACKCFHTQDKPRRGRF
jgi:hypothetical protein